MFRWRSLQRERIGERRDKNVEKSSCNSAFPPALTPWMDLEGGRGRPRGTEGAEGSRGGPRTPFVPQSFLKMFHI